MIDINLLRTNPEIAKDSQRKRGIDISIIDKVLEADKKWRTLKGELDNLKAERNKLGEEIGKLKKAGKNPIEQLNRVSILSGKVKKSEEDLAELEKNRDTLLIDIPNILHESVPQGKDDTGNVEIKKIGKIPKFAFPVKDHIDIGAKLDLFDTDRAAKTSGARFYFLKNEAVLLELALAQYAMDYLVNKKDFTPVIVPDLVKERVMYGVGMLPHSKQEIYKIENEDLYLVLTAEHAIGGLHMDETFKEDELPKRYAGFSSCFRTEAGAHGRDTKGIFRVHQFEKVEMFIFCKPEDSWKEHELLLECAEHLVQGLELPYRIVNICTGDIGSVAAKKYDIEAWLPGQNAYREIISCSNCTDFQARRLNTRVLRPGMKTDVVHTLNSTALALGRTIVAILENNQNKDGSINVPKVLQKYCGLKKIGPRK